VHANTKKQAGSHNFNLLNPLMKLFWLWSSRSCENKD